MFGIGGGELVFIIFIALMLFGADKIPDIARSIGKGMAQLKSATNEIKSEIQKGADATGVTDSMKQMTSSFNDEVEKVKSNLDSNIVPDATKVKEELEDLTGPIKKTIVMLEKILQIDKELLIFLNGLGSESYDGLWLIITKQVYWTPIFLLVFYLLQKKLGWKNFGYYLLFTALLIAFCDQTANLFKWYFHRLRPCNDESINHIIRVVKGSPSFSFFSGHAATSMSTTVFGFMIIKKYYKHSYLLFLFPLIFAYSRIYLGVHYPTDIVTGYIFGAAFGFVCYKLYRKYILRTRVRVKRSIHHE